MCHTLLIRIPYR